MGSSDKLFFGGTIHTVDSRVPVAEAAAVRDGTIAAVGGLSFCKGALGPNPELFDLKGGCLLPGFCDAHMHPLPTIFYAMNCDLQGVRNLGELRDRLRRCARETGPDAWVIGLNFNEQGMHDPVLPTRFDLDRVTEEKPVLILKHDGHSIIASSLAMEKSGVTDQTKPPAGGSMDRDERGRPLGIFREFAESLILSHVPLPGIDDITRAGRQAFEGMLHQGITSLGLILDTGRRTQSGALGSYDIPAMELLKPYIRQSLSSFFITGDVSVIEEAKGTFLDDPKQGNRIAGLKIIADGTFGSCTAAMEEPFTDMPGNAGFMLRTDEEIYGLMEQAHAAGYQIAIHAIGDRANRTCIGLYERLLREHPGQARRHRIEHASILDREMIAKVRELGLVLCVQPMFIHSDMPFLEKRIGRERMEHTYPFRSLREAGVPLAGSSDSPIESQDVLSAIECAVTREGYVPEQAVTPAQAVEMYTLQAAFSQCEEGSKGSITPGKRADLVLLEESPLRVSPGEIHSIGVLKTFIAGELVFSR